MKRRIIAASALLCLITGCASIDGVYTPDCIAYSGDNIRLDGGRFVWDKFSDQVLVNDAGEAVDQYPEYPLRGRYRVEDDTIHFDSYTGEPLPSMHLRQEGDRTYLLTQKQYESWLNANDRPRCPLVLGGRMGGEP